MNVFCWMDGDTVLGYSRLRSTEDQVEMLQTDADAAMSQNSFDAIRETKLDETMKLCEATLNQLTGKYPEAERLSWTKQEAEALAKRADSNAPTPLISKLAAGRGATVEALSTIIRKKAAAFTVGAGIAIGERQRCEGLLSAMTSANSDLEDISGVQYTLPGDFWVQVQTAYVAET